MNNALKPDWLPSDCTSDPTYNRFEKLCVSSGDPDWDLVKAQNEFYQNTYLPKIVDLLLPFDE